MSGPIVRKYGFPNFEKIFGERAIQHGTEDETPKSDDAHPAADPARPSPATGTESKPGGEARKA